MSDLLSLAIIWSGVFAAYLLADKTRLTPVLYFLAFGSLMVNLGILPEESSEFIRGFAEIGIILIMFALGFDEDAGHFVAGIKRSWGIAFFGAIFPFIAAYLITFYFWQDSNLAIICGLAMTATAVSLTMVSLKSEGLQGTQAATGIMTSAILDDVASLAAVAILIPLATGSAEFSALGIAAVLFKASLFFIIITGLELVIFPHDSKLSLFKTLPWLRRFGIRDFIAFKGGEHATLAVLLISLLISLLAHWFGFHPAVGAYMAGLIIKQQYFYHDLHHDSDGRVDRSTDHQSNSYQQTQRIVDNVAFSWIGPVFFVDLGTKIILDQSVLIAVIPHIITLTLSLFIAQILSAGLAARFTGNFAWHESILIGVGMLGRAELAFVVLNIGYVQYDLITTEAFYTLMATAFFLNLAVPITVKLWKPYFRGEKSASIALFGKQLVLSQSEPEDVFQGDAINSSDRDSLKDDQNPDQDGRTENR